MKLTAKQKEVILKMRDGVPYYFNGVTTVRPYSEGDYGSSANPVHGATLLSMEKAGLITKHRHNIAIYQYQLTELGKTIEL